MARRTIQRSASGQRRRIWLRLPWAGKLFSMTEKSTGLTSSRAPEPVGAYPHARRVGDLLFLSGVGPRKRGSKEIPGDIEATSAIARALFDGHLHGNAIGIGFDEIPKVFEPFSQVDNYVSREQEGTGLGLPLVKSMIELHGGTIELESELGDGTIVTIRFPAERVLDDPAKTKGDGIKVSAAQ